MTPEEFDAAVVSAVRVIAAVESNRVGDLTDADYTDRLRALADQHGGPEHLVLPLATVALRLAADRAAGGPVDGVLARLENEANNRYDDPDGWDDGDTTVRPLLAVIRGGRYGEQDPTPGGAA